MESFSDIIPIVLTLAGILAAVLIIRKVLGDNPYLGTGCGGG